jgi:hypothetical protein
MTTPTSRASVTVPLDEFQKMSTNLTTGGALMIAGAAFAVGVIIGGFVLPEGDADPAPRPVEVGTVATPRAA